MKVTCSSCGAEYQIDDRKIPATGAFVTCKTCSAKIRLTPPSAAKPEAPAAASEAIALPGSSPAPESGASGASGDAPSAAVAAPTPRAPATPKAPTPPVPAMPRAPTPPGVATRPGGAPASPPAKPDAGRGRTPTQKTDVIALPGTDAPAFAGGAAPAVMALPLDAGPAVAVPLTDQALAELSGADVLPKAAAKSAPPAPGRAGAIPLGAPAAAGKAVPLPAATGRAAAVPLPGVGRSPTGPAPVAAVALPAAIALPAAAVPLTPVSAQGLDLVGVGAMPFTDPDHGPPSLAPLALASATPLELNHGPKARAPAPPPGPGAAHLDSLFDLPAAVTPQAVAPTPAFLQDLPVAVDDSPPRAHASLSHGSGSPTAGSAPVPPAGPSPAARRRSAVDLAAADGLAPATDEPADDGVMEAELTDVTMLPDAAAPLGSAPSAGEPAVAAVPPEPPIDDLPIGADVAPSLMDDLPLAASKAPVGVAAPPLDDLGAVPAPGDPFAGVAPPGPGAPPPIVAPGAGEAAAVPTPRQYRGLRVALVGAVAVAATVAAAVILAPTLGLDFWRTRRAKDASRPAAAKTAAAPAPAPAAAPSAAPPAAAPAPKPAPPPVETVVLAVDNVDALSYGTLRKSVETLAAQAPAEGEPRDLLWWGWFRLAHTFGDEAAAEKLLSELPRKLEDPAIGPLGAAAGIGVLILEDKVPMARNTVERLRKGPGKDSPHLAYVAGLAFEGPGPKALKLYERAAKVAPQMVDARLAAAAAQLPNRTAGGGVDELRRLVGDGKDLDLSVRVVERLIDAEHFAEIDEMLTALSDIDQVDHVAPARLAQTARLLTRQRLQHGDLEGAVAAAKRRVELEPQQAAAAIELAFLEQAIGRNGAETLAAAYQRIEDVADRSRLVAEQVRLALAKGDAPGAATLLESAADLPKKDAAGWLKVAEGWIAENSGKLPRAKAAYVAAQKGRPKFAEPKLAALLLEPGAPPQELARLTQLSKQSDLVAADYRLAKAMEARGNLAGALELMESVMWGDGLPIDPIELLLGWIDLLAHCGQQPRAEQVAQTMLKARPKDQRPLRALIDIAESQEDDAKAADWWRQLVLQSPDNFSYKAALAAHLMAAGRDAEARTMLDDVQGNKEAMKSPLVLFRLGQAWATREPIKARGYLIEARALEPSAEIHLLLGQIDEARDKADTAIEAYREALNLQPGLDAARRRLARLLLSVGRLDDAEIELRDLAARLPNDLEVSELMGDCLRDMEKPKEALKAYLRAAAAPTPSLALLLKVGKLQLQDLGQVGPSVRTLRRAIQLDPKAAEPLYLLGYALKDLGRIREAREALEQYLTVAPKDDLADEVRADLRDLRE